MNTTYTIKEVAEIFQLSISTLHYYDKQGLLPFVAKNSSGHREFTSSDLSFIHTICCLKQTGMPLRDIRSYIDDCMQGTATIDTRRDMLLAHKKRVLQKQQELANSLIEIDKKIERYTAPNADTIIERQIAYAEAEKRSHHLASGFQAN